MGRVRTSERAHDESARLREIGVAARLTPNMRRRVAIGSDQHEECARSTFITNQTITYIIRRCDVM
jgi:hypothetical protein